MEEIKGISDEIIPEKKVESVFKNKNFNLLFFGALVSRFGDSLFNFAMGWYVLELTKSAFLASLYVAIGMVTYIVLQLFGGVIADRFDKVKLIYGTDFLRGIALIFCLFGLISSQDIQFKIMMLYLSNFLLSIFGGIFSPAISSLQPRIVSEDQYQQSQSYFSIINHLTNVIGLLLGGILYMLLGVYLIFIINAISYILSGISEMFIKIHDDSNKVKIKLKQFLKGMYGDFKEGFSYLKKDNTLISVIIFAILINFFSIPFFLIYPQFLFNQILKTSAFHFSLTEAFFSFAAIIGAIILSIMKQPEKVYKNLRLGIINSVIITLFLTILFYSIIILKINFILFMILISILMILMGFTNALINIPFNVVFMKRIDKNYFGRIMSIFGLLVGIANPIAMILFGSLVDFIGLIITMVISFLGSIIGIIYLIHSKYLKQI